jgi:hypothetical protein
MKGQMMKDSLVPERLKARSSLILPLADVQGVSHHQRPAHTQAVKASQETDQQRGKEIINHK